MKRHPSLLLLLFFVLISLSFEQPLFPREPSSSSEEILVLKALEKKLYLKPVWLRLLHYRGGPGNYHSEADGLSFFMAGASGKDDPKAELLANIRGFFQSSESMRKRSQDLVPELVKSGIEIDPNVHPACMFPARYEWLGAELSETGIAFPKVECPNLQIYLEDIPAHSLSIVFASYFMSEPASMFGHTLLKFNSGQDGGRSDLLDYAVNYAAPAVDVDPFSYVILGLGGGFPGRFTLMPYHLKVQEYNDSESRDVWEYELDLKDYERRRAVLHLWELASTYFDYYFIDENCAYHLLGVVEVARPDLDLKSAFGGWVIPGETIKELLKNKGLVKRRIYRPSHMTKIRAALHDLSPEEVDLYRGLLEGSLSPEGEAFQSSPLPSQIRSLDLALSVFRYRKESKKFDDEDSSIYRNLLLTRTTLPAGEPDKPIEPASRPVEEGHGLRRVSLGAGLQGGKAFTEVGFRPLFHDILGRHNGFSNRAELVYTDGAVRYVEGEKAPVLDRLEVIRITGLAPMDSLTSPVTFQVNGGFQSEEVDANEIRLSQEEEYWWNSFNRQVDGWAGNLPAYLVYKSIEGNRNQMRSFGRMAYDLEAISFCNQGGAGSAFCQSDLHQIWTLQNLEEQGDATFLEDSTVRTMDATAEVFLGKTLPVGPEELGFQWSLLAGARARYDLYYTYRSTILPGIRTILYYDAGIFRAYLEGSLYLDRGESLMESRFGVAVAPGKNHEIRLTGRAWEKKSEVTLAYAFYY